MFDYFFDYIAGLFYVFAAVNESFLYFCVLYYIMTGAYMAVNSSILQQCVTAMNQGVEMVFSEPLIYAVFIGFILVGIGLVRKFFRTRG